MKLLFLLLSLLLVGCSKFEPHLEVQVTVQRNKDAGTWHLSYKTSQPFQTIDFERQRYRLRSSSWKILSDGVKLVSDGSGEKIVSSKPIDHFEADFDDRVPGVANDYPIVSHYSDGGAVLYTGHLFLKVPDCDGCKVTHKFSFQTSDDESIISESNNGPEGDFVYFGQDQLQEFDNFKVVMDEGLPPWIKRQVKRAIPTFIVHYQDKLGFPLKQKPLVFVAYDKATLVNEEGYIGGVVGSHMQLVLVGDNWRSANGTRYEEFAHLVAHETFHLWNGSLFLAPDRVGGSWLHEGSADAIADYTLYELGFYNEDRYHQIQTERLNRCLLGLSQKSLPNSDEDGFYRNFYECGAVMNHLIERKLPDGVTLFDFWKAIFASAQNSFYTHQQFFNSASSVVTDPQVVSALLQMVSGSTGEPGNFFENTFNNLGINYSVSTSDFPGWYEDLASQNVVGLLALRDCGSALPTDLTESGIYVDGGDQCNAFKSQHELVNVSGYTLPTNGAEAYDSLYYQCSSTPTTVAVDSGGQELVTSCHDFPKRPDYLNW